MINDQELIELLKEKTVDEVITLDEDLFYRLSKERGNVLSCADFDKEDEVLEYSYECYSLTYAYINKVKNVTKITKSPEIEEALYGKSVRCIKSLDEKKYSKIILNGVLDYLDEEEGKDLVEAMKEHLSSNGVIIMTLTNKYSINLLSGAKKYGENEYFTSLTSKKMFSKTKITNLLDSLNLTHYFYYPLPGYLVASEIYSEDFLPEENTIKGIKDSFIGKRYVVFDDDLALNQSLKEGNFDLLTPAYLVIAGTK